ncbi:gamma-glutamyl-gamma-aminobutyrate hydrolase family protein [Leifsonia sp. F6_8S_P_1B]|uniref:Gamma-glutamyl-gamma-aminobutyrate hydrolase family protein n=1 Tax=Leifsonia williamsii TaxID=3035919 RepID=A0ABT8KB48_9MICO|nr:gamma-glutamyl-gamma-aminobutyrate hydrolase family protein [Leifsonia williamsii]MDN4614670.1 gamma-glutamyl-gamma-aminobutyrate hydrolase family protein [Leifsonia williamsii]
MPASGARSLAVVEATRFRGHDPAYHAYVQLLVGSVIAEAEAQAWRVNRLAADEGRELLLARTEAADAVVIVGGEDIAPRFYGGSTGYPHESRHLEVADDAQLALVHRSIERGVPLLGICRGLQIVNVALGGTLLQDLGDHAGHVNRGVPIPEVLTTHPVLLEEGSLAQRLLGGSVVDVRSAHHQAVDVVGEGLVVTGRAPDGHVEAIEHRDAPVLAVQWHPEDRLAPAGQLAALLGALSAVPAAAVAA